MQSERRSQRFLVLTLAVGVFLGGYAVNRYWTGELSHFTGGAEWIWTTNALERPHPEAGLFVASLDLDAPPPSALLKVCGDREYVVYINGSPAACGWSRPGFRLDLFDVGHLLRQGPNVIAAEVRSPSPAGGLLLALDVGGVGTNVLVSGPTFSWRRRFALGPHDPSDRRVPVVWGAPPRYPWGYPKLAPHPATLDEVVHEDPIRVDAAAARRLPGGGWEFDLARPTFGYLWLEFAGDESASESTTAETGVVDVGAMRGRAQPVVRIAGQQRWLDPQPRILARVCVFATSAPRAVEVWPVAAEFSSTAPGLVPGRFGRVPRTRWTIRSRQE
jgi:hypothetical protein